MKNKMRFTALFMAACLGTELYARMRRRRKKTQKILQKQKVQGRKPLYLEIPPLIRKMRNQINPHNAYAGWACMRYGVGETLFKYSDSMEIQPWLAKDYENVDELT